MNFKDQFAPIMINLAGAAIVSIVLFFIGWASPVLAPILFAFFLTAIAYPVFSALKNRGMNRGLSLVLLVAGMQLVGLLIAVLILVGTGRLASGIESYGGLIQGRQAEIDAALDSVALGDSGLTGALNGERLADLLIAISAITVRAAGNSLVAVVLAAFLLLESGRFAAIFHSTTSEHPMVQKMPAVMLFLVLSEDEKTQWLARFISRDGSLPQEEERPAVLQT